MTAAGLYKAFGEEKTLFEWVEDPRSKVRHIETVKTRLRSGLSVEEALTKEVEHVGRGRGLTYKKARKKNKEISEEEKQYIRLNVVPWIYERSLLEYDAMLDEARGLKPIKYDKNRTLSREALEFFRKGVCGEDLDG